jgi:dTMP kinase
MPTAIALNSYQTQPMKPLFIVFEGIDGSGKSTQAEKLREYFIQQGDRAVISPEPTEGIIGKLIRKAMRDKILLNQQGGTFDEQMAYLFAADRHYHLFNELDGVYALMQRDRTHVISTRYYFSSLAYNTNSPEDYAFISRLNHHFPNPDLVIYLDLSVAIALERLSQCEALEIYETETKLTQVKANYDQIWSQYQGNLLIIDGSMAIDEIHKQVILNPFKWP